MGRTFRNKDKQTKKFLKQYRRVRRKRGIESYNEDNINTNNYDITNNYDKKKINDDEEY